MSHSDLASVLEEIQPEEWLDYLGVNYRQSTGSSGRQLQVKECPRCGGNKWKVYLNAETGLGNCFHGSCVGESGFNLFSFSKHYLGDGKIAYQEMVEYAKSLGWRPRPSKTAKAPVLNKSLVQLPDSIELPQGTKNHPYLIQRGFSLETTEYFQWRYCKSGAFYYDDSDKKRRSQDYSGRIIIPVMDSDGQLVTFQGRDITGKAARKYLFPPGLPGTARYLYNGQNAVGATEVVINEGAFDVAATFQAFQEDDHLRTVIPIGTFGKALTMGATDQADQLGALFSLKEKGLKKVTFMWDAERKTLNDAAIAAEKLHTLGFDVYLARLPDNCDPNESTPEQVRRSFYKAIRITKQALLRFRMGLLSHA